MSAQPTTVPVDSLALATTDLEPASALQLRSAFEEMFSSAEKWAASARLIVITSIDQKREMKMARESRLALREIRVKAEHARKRLKEDSTRRGKAIDGIANVLKALIEPIEAHLLEQAREAKRVEAVKVEAARVERERVQIEENARLQKEKFDLETAALLEREAAAKEAATLRTALAVETESARADVVRIERELVAARAEADAEAARVREVHEAERFAAEKETRRKHEGDRLARQAAELAPDRDKLAAFAALLRTLEIPTLTTPTGKAAAIKVAAQIEKMATWVANTGASL